MINSAYQSVKIFATLLLALLALPIFAQVQLTDEYQQARALYQHGEGNPKNFAAALTLFKSAAEKGDPRAQFYVGRMYQYGHSVERDGAEAARWYWMAAEQGQPFAYNNLGNIYAHGHDVPKDGERALMCYIKASDIGAAMGSKNAGVTYLYAKYGIPRDYAQARKYLQRCVEQNPDYDGAWNNLGIALVGSQEGLPSDYAGAEQAFLRAVEQDDFYAYWNLSDLYYEGHRPASSERIIELLEKGAAKDHTLCLNRLGWFYEIGKFVDRDTDKAIELYERSAALGSDNAKNYLAVLLVESGKVAETAPRVIQLLQESADDGNLYAMNNLGHRLVVHDVPGHTREEGVALLIKSAQGGNDDAIRNLVAFAKKPEIAQQMTAEQLRWIEERRVDNKQTAKAAAQEALASTETLVAEKRYDEALAELEKQLSNWQGVDKNEDAFIGALWWDAQVLQGRADPEWSWRLFDWIKNRYDHQMQHQVQNRLIVRLNIATALIECGRMGMLHELADETRVLLAELDGIHVDEILANARDHQAPYPLRYTADLQTRHRRPEDVNAWISYAAMSALQMIATERLYAADWATVNQLCDWMDAWALAVIESDVIPRGAVKGFVMEAYLDSLLLRAQAYEYQYDFTAAATLYDNIHELNWQSYDGNATNSGNTRRAALKLRLNPSELLELAVLDTLVERRKNNKYDHEQGYQETRLVIARALHAQAKAAEAKALVDEILAYAEAEHRPFLRLDALLTSIDLALADLRYDGVENQLFEALKFTREQGLKVAEPPIYDRYVKFLIATERLPEAVDVQQEQIKLLRKLNIPLGLPDALAQLAAIYRQMGNAPAELQSLRANPLLAEQQAARIAELAPLVASASEPVDFSFDLQPMTLTSSPLPGQPLEAIFTLSNLGDTTSELTLQAEATHPIQFKDVAAEADPIVVFMPGPDPKADETAVTFDAQEQRFVRIKMPAGYTDASDVSLTLLAQRGDTQVRAELLILTNGEAASTAIIDAQELEDNPFYLVSAFHHLANATPGQPQTVALRAIASQPTRVEAYDAFGALLFIDAQGNGSFTDPGDVLATPHISGNAPLITVESAARVIELRYQPLADQNTAIDIQLQRAPNAPELQWSTDAIDRLAPFQSESD